MMTVMAPTTLHQETVLQCYLLRHFLRNLETCPFKRISSMTFLHGGLTMTRQAVLTERLNKFRQRERTITISIDILKEHPHLSEVHVGTSWLTARTMEAENGNWNTQIEEKIPFQNHHVQAPLIQPTGCQSCIPSQSDASHLTSV